MHLLEIHITYHHGVPTPTSDPPHYHTSYAIGLLLALKHQQTREKHVANKEMGLESVSVFPPILNGYW